MAHFFGTQCTMADQNISAMMEKCVSFSHTGLQLSCPHNTI